MIVRNESTLIAETLTHLRESIDSAVICDTGSTDDTIGCIRETCDRLRLPLLLQEHPWHDFGTNRTLAFQAARTIPSDFFLVFDADDVLLDPIDRSQLDLAVDAYYFMQGTERNRYVRLTLFRATLEWEYCGVLHEFPKCVSKVDIHTRLLPFRVAFNKRGTSARNQDRAKYRKDADLLIQALCTETDPGLIARYLYYTGRSLMDAGEYAQAIVYFSRYLSDPQRWFEERFDCWMCIGRCRWSLQLPLNTIRDAFLQAVVEDPDRAEPWHELARVYRTFKEFPTAYAYAKTGLRVSTVPERTLFLDPTVYAYRLHDELAIAAFWMNRKDECRRICETLLQRTDLSDADRERIETNRQHCL
jgi:glycosyltransferase involved in cell wall biosynthesis